MAPALRVRRAAIALALSCLAVTRAAAHEIGTTNVTASIRASEYEVLLVADPASLLGRLETIAGRPRSGPLTGEQYGMRITSLRQQFLAGVDIRFDGVRAAVGFEYHAGPDTEYGVSPATIRFTGPVPAGARGFTWRYGLTNATYAFVASHDGHKGTALWLEGPQASPVVPLRAPSSVAGTTRAAWTYFALGFTHIVPRGLDHILFVLGLFFFSRRLRPLLWQVTAFTVAHSVTLALSIFGVVRLTPAVVEPLIALSIAYVAVENLLTSTLHAWRLALVFSFGLLHGLGFAGVLGELGLPPSQAVTALVSFNLGVEAGQLAVIGAAFALVARWTTDQNRYRRRVVVPASASIALMGVYWTVQRL